MRPEIQQQVEELLRRFEVEPQHVRCVARLADELFVGLRKWHKLGQKEREFLHVASLLHDIGWSQTPTGQGHHKHSARLIRAHPWRGFKPREFQLIAQMARYHRKSLPGSHHRRYCALTAHEQKLVAILAGLLRVADALDRTHSSVVQSVQISYTRKEIRLLLQVHRACTAELKTLDKKRIFSNS